MIRDCMSALGEMKMTELSAEKLADLREIAEAARDEWASKVPTRTLRQFHEATYPTTVLALLDLIAEQQAELAQVEAFINQRPEYVTALKNTRGGDSTEDYCRWSGHAEARRQLATSLNLTTPHEPGEKATRYGVADDE